MKRATPEEAGKRVMALQVIILSLRQNCGRAHVAAIPRLSKKVRSALKSAQGALRNAERFL
jgi:hypothetical protein